MVKRMNGRASAAARRGPALAVVLAGVISACSTQSSESQRRAQRDGGDSPREGSGGDGAPGAGGVGAGGRRQGGGESSDGAGGATGGSPAATGGSIAGGAGGWDSIGDCVHPCGHFVVCGTTLPAECGDCPASSSGCPGDCAEVTGRQLFPDGCLGVPEVVGCVTRSQASADPGAACMERASDGVRFHAAAGDAAPVLLSSGQWRECGDAGSLAVEAGLGCTHCGCDRGLTTTLECICTATAVGGSAPPCPADPAAFMRAACDDPAIDWVARVAAPEHDELHVYAGGRGQEYFYDRSGRLVGAVVRDTPLTCSDRTASPFGLGGGHTPLPDGRERTCIGSCFRREEQLLPHPCRVPEGGL